ncbi:23S ribosomal RNA methyltransferase Erm [Nocardia speluncae]|uniref:23S ribosomal RNA methyltransferase Erm n=1 Tax=Nocardia speluncae TaxID=419477 RepID=A0A846XC51_9NOCA|nr:23S ribosomal RNA methyltransferase Erm [Nocardia speluncae]NKY32360.1 23S ribosomal RNA methyltransferase Erm [Nocardia speluncae]
MSRSTTRPRARKRLSQNFLTEPATARRIVGAAGIGPSDFVLEIGPGDGMLTRHLIRQAGRVVAYERDPHYARRLAVRYDDNDRIRIVHKDFRCVEPPEHPFAVVGNIPFGASTDILRWCLAAPRLTAATLLTQYEFARKYSGNYGRWTKSTITHWPDSVPALGERIDRGEFFPVPRVDGAILRIVRRPVPLLPAGARSDYRRMVELGFSGVGGSLGASLRRAHSARMVARACAAADIATDLPVGLVPPAAWLTLYHRLYDTAPPEYDRPAPRRRR